MEFEKGCLMVQSPPMSTATISSGRNWTNTPQRLLQVILLTLVLVVCFSNLYLGTRIHHMHHHVNQSNNNNPQRMTRPISENDERRKVEEQPTTNMTTDDTSHTPVYFASLGERPPLSEIVKGRDVIGNVSWLLDFAVVGFPKCGTTSIMRHLQSHPGVAIHDDERCDLSYNNQGYLARALYRDFPHDVPLKRGLKCPVELENNLLAMPNYRKFFPDTRFIIGGEFFFLLVAVYMIIVCLVV